MSLPNNIIQIRISSKKISDPTNNFENISKTFDLKEYSYQLFDNESIQKLMSDNKDYDVLEAYNILEPYAFKADLARYYIIDRLGGIYVDSNIFFESSAVECIKNELFFYDDPEHTKSVKPVYNGLFVSDKNNHVLQLAIKEVLLHVKHKFYGSTALDISGPSMLGLVGMNYFPRKTLGQFCIGGQPARKRFYINNSEIAVYKPDGKLPGDSGILGGNSYIDIWNSRNVYGEKK